MFPDTIYIKYSHVDYEIERQCICSFDETVIDMFISLCRLVDLLHALLEFAREKCPNVSIPLPAAETVGISGHHSDFYSNARHLHAFTTILFPEIIVEIRHQS